MYTYKNIFENEILADKVWNKGEQQLYSTSSVGNRVDGFILLITGSIWHCKQGY